MPLTPEYATRVVSFADFQLDVRAGELRRTGVKVKLQNQPFQVLATLLEHPGEIVTRDELRALLWPAETFVDFDHGLNSAVRRLREALGDSAETPIFVETVGRRGYRFIFPAEKTYSNNGNGNGAVLEMSNSVAAPEVRTATPARALGRSRRRQLLLAAGVLVLIATSLLLMVERMSDGKLSKWVQSIGRGVPGELSIKQRQLTANPSDMPVTSQAFS